MNDTIIDFKITSLKMHFNKLQRNDRLELNACVIVTCDK